MSNKVVLSVYFEGTGSPVSKYGSQVSQFAHYTDAYDISEEKTPIEDDQTQFKMMFDGCGVAYGLRGLLFGHGLEIQCVQVVKRINELLNAGKTIKLNVLGLSRGGVAGLFLAKMLKDIDPLHLKTNLILFDPVPGNLISLRKLDFLQITNANKAMDLRESKNLCSVLGIYPYMPLPAIAFHAPIVPLYPKHTQVEQVITPGQHQGALRQIFSKDSNSKSALSFQLISRQLTEKGTSFVESTADELAWSDEQAEQYMREYENNSSTLRYTHNRHGFSGVKICYTPKGQYMNQLHYEMANKENLNPSENPTFKMEFQPPLQSQTRKKVATPNEGLLHSFSQQIEANLSKQSRKTLKGNLMQGIIKKLSDDVVLTKKESNYVLRDILALTLQRDRNPYNFFNCRTGSGKSALKLINSSDYKPLRKLIKPTGKRVTYADLRAFVLGENNYSYFNAANKKSTYAILSGVDKQFVQYEIKDRYSQFRTA